jgi:ABC-type branched-subunit amino acid transport system substrate-binding protein
MALTFASAIALLAGSAVAQQGDRIRIGVVSSLTGPAATLGVNTLAGAKLALKEINDKGGIMGRQGELVVADDQSNPTLTVNEAKRLIHQEKVQVALGPLGSLTAVPAVPIFNEAKMVNISISTSNLMTVQAAPYHFTPVVSTDEVAKVYVNHVADVVKAKSFAVLTDNTAGSQALFEPIKTAAAARGLTITMFQEAEFNASDVTPQVLAIRRTNPGAIVHSSVTGKDAGMVIKAVNEVGWDIPMVFSTSMAAGVPAVIQVAGPDALKNPKIAAWEYKAMTFCPGDAPGQSEVAKFLVRLKAAEPANFEKISATNAVWFYDAVYTLKAMIEGAKSTDGPAMTAWMEKNAGTIPALMGRQTASPQSHFLFDASALTTVSDLLNRSPDGLRKRAGC